MINIFYIRWYIKVAVKFIANCKNNGTFLMQFAILAKLTKVHKLMSFAISISE